MTDRVPPHDLDAEAAVISAAMLDRAAIDAAGELVKPTHFYSNANRRVFEAIIELATRNEPVDVVTVAGYLRDRDRLNEVGGTPYLAQLVDSVPAVANVESYANIVVRKARMRELIVTCQRVAAEGYGPVSDVDAFIDEAERTIFQISQRDERRETAPMEVVMRESYLAMRAAEARDGMVELSTGILDLDKKIGGLGRGRLTIIAARPGMGKTSLATGIAENIAATGKPACVFSLEMPRAQLGMRMACSRANASVFRGLNGWLNDRERCDVLRAKDELKRFPIWIDDTPALTLMRMRSKARAVAARAGKPLALVVVDYLQLMGGSGATRDRELSAITGGMKQLSKELNCAVLLLSQLNREVENEKDKRPRLHHLRESGGIEQDADDVIFIYRDDNYHADSPDKGKAELIVAKQRNGPTGVVKVQFLGASTTFLNLTAVSA
jgi:replicative DNA helicase